MQNPACGDGSNTMKNYSCMRAFKPPLAVALALASLAADVAGRQHYRRYRKSFNGIRACSRLRLEATLLHQHHGGD
jgi:hypothetical protein